MGLSMSRDRQGGIGGGRMLPLAALLLVLREYVPAGASRPPVTAVLLAANVLVYLRPGALDALLPRLPHVAFNPHHIIKDGDLKRFFLSAFYHFSDNHISLNMISLLRMGVELETSMGSVEFASMVASLLGLSPGITLLLSRGLLLLGDSTQYYTWSAGFSGVLFGMNVVLNGTAWTDDVIFLLGMEIPAKCATWAGLLLTQALVPEAHFLGHLGGVLAGLVYLRLKHIISGTADAVSSPARFARRLRRLARGLLRAPRLQGSSAGHRRAPPGDQIGNRRGLWRCSACSYHNSPSADICETCSIPHEDCAFSRRRGLGVGGSDGELSVEEIHGRRLQRFER